MVNDDDDHDEEEKKEEETNQRESERERQSGERAIDDGSTWAVVVFASDEADDFAWKSAWKSDKEIRRCES